MVYKVCKGGVRSGNTLRGLNSRVSSKYSRHACLISKASCMSKREVRKLAQSSTDDDMVSETVQSTDVIMSLNKKQRWLLPSMMRHMIRSGFFSSETKVSLLERHKLKRRANCVSFVSNKGRTTYVQPKQKRYFSYGLKYSQHDKSKREQRLNMAKSMPSGKKNIFKGRSDKTKTIKVFTMSGPETPTEEKEGPSPSQASQKPEYTMEIFYPCPKSCSLAYNPKYTDVAIEENESGEHEVRAVKHQGQSKASKRLRSRLVEPNYVKMSEEDLDRDVREMWEECSLDNEDIDNSTMPTTSVAINDVSENMWAKLIDEAEKAKSLCFQKTRSPRRESSRSSATESSYFDMPKQHIIHFAKDRSFVEDDISSIQNDMIEPINEVIEHPVNASFRIIADSFEVSPSELRNRFGQMYSEAACYPRKFILNISEDVSNIFSLSKSVINNNIAFTSFIIYTFDGPYDEGIDTYRVSFNSLLSEYVENLLIDIPFQKLSIDQLINTLINCILDSKSKNVSNLTKYQIHETNNDLFHRFLNDQLNLNVETIQTNIAILQLHQTEMSSLTESFHEKLSRFANTEERFCQICYECVTSSQADSVQGTAMSRCNHSFCDQCWAFHIRTKIANGALKVPCPAYECDIIVDCVTLLSLVPATEVSKLLQRQKEAEVETSEHSKWCPNPDCGRIIKVNKSSPNMAFDVKCTCGYNICFSCLQDAHWPATCDQADLYSDQFNDIDLPVETLDDTDKKSMVSTIKPKKLSKMNKKKTIIEVEGKLCPKCSRFIQKNGGCPMMVCRCGGTFCWSCIKPVGPVPHVCRPNIPYVTSMTRILQIRHVKPKPPVKSNVITANVNREEGNKDNKKPRKQKVTLYQRAKQQRNEGQHKHNNLEEFAFAMATHASKNQDLRDEIFDKCSEVTNLQYQDNGYLSIKKLVKQFLIGCENSRQALHHVTEFTLVLLQDLPSSSLDKRRALALVNDISGYCSFTRSILEAGTSDLQKSRTALRRLLDIQIWSKRAVTSLIKTVNRLKTLDNFNGNLLDA